MKKFVFHIYLILILYWPCTIAQSLLEFHFHQDAQLLADAGLDTTVFPGTLIQLGGIPAAIGGSGVYIYHWEPEYLTDYPDTANPQVIIDSLVVFLLQVTDSKGCTASDEVIINVDALSLNYKGLQPDNVVVAPNPASEQITLKIKEVNIHRDIEIFILTTSGDVIFKENKTLIPCGNNMFSYDLTNLPNGSYIIRVRGYDMDVSKRIIKY